MASDDRQRESIDDLDALLAALPPEIVDAVHALPDRTDLIEVVLDLGRRPEARFPDSEVTLLEREITEADIAYVVEHIGTFGDDNRAGIERTLHRISAIRNRNGKIVGLTCRIGRAVYGTIEIINDFVETGKSILIMGRPGIGKTTMLREAARVLADDMGKRVVVVDTSNEIAGDGDIPHPAIGKARRMQVRTPSLQHEVMIEAVENHMPQVIVIDEIGTELEAQAARTIAERGVQLIGTAHGNNLDNLMLNPTLSDLIGGIQSVTLGDEEARRRRTQKSVLERKAPPTFDVIVEIQDRERVAVHSDVAETVDAMLRGDPVAPELRWRDEEGVHRIARAGRGRRRASSSARSGSPASSGRARRGGWSPAGAATASYRTGGYREADRGAGVPARLSAGRVRRLAPDARRVRPRERRRAGPSRRVAHRDRCPASGSPARPGDAPFVAGDIADRGPLERGRRADARRDAGPRGARARAPEGLARPGGPGAQRAEGRGGDRRRSTPTTSRPTTLDELPLGDRGGPARRDACSCPGGSPLPTLRVLPQGISRKRLEQAIRDLQLPVVIARDVDEADVVMTLRNEYKQKTPMLREAEERAMPIYVLKSNTIPQMQASLTSIFSLEIDPREAALRETEDAIERRPVVVRAGRAVAAERLHPAAPAPDGRAGEPRLALARPRAVPARPALPGRGPQPLAVTAPLALDFLGHSALVIDLDGVRLVDRPGDARPGRAARGGSSRCRRATRLHGIDAVLISHLHWDHLDVPSLQATSAGARRSIVPAGAGAWLRGAGFTDVRELALGETIEIGGGPGRRPSTRSTPGSGRRSGRRRRRSATSLEGSRTVYFAGDTDLFDGMADAAGPDRRRAHPGLGLGPDARSRPAPRSVARGRGAAPHPAARGRADPLGHVLAARAWAGSSRSGWSSRRRPSSSTPRSWRPMCGCCRRRSATA